MNTTVLVDSTTRDALARTRDRYGVASMDDAIRRVLRDATPTASQLWRKHRRQASQVCAEHGVTRLIAFGSRCRDDRHPGSDLDLLVEFPSDSGMRGFFDLRDKLSNVFGVVVDMGELGAANDRLLKHIREEGVAFVGPPP